VLHSKTLSQKAKTTKKSLTKRGKACMLKTAMAEENEVCEKTPVLRDRTM
jgi:hypothetical protein